MKELYRMLLARRWTAAWVIVSVALSLGAVASVFSIADRLLVRPPAGVRDASTVGRIVARALDPQSGSPPFEQAMFSYPVYVAVADAVRPHVQLAAYTEPESKELLLGEVAVPVRVSLADPNYFELLGVGAAAGSVFRRSDPASSTGPIVILSERLARRLDLHPQRLLGTSITIGQHTATVAGIAGGDFSGTDVAAADVWLPLEWAGRSVMGERWTSDPQVYPLSVVARYPAGTPRNVAAQRVRSALQLAHVGGNDLRYLGAELVPLTTAGSARTAGESKLTVWLAVMALAIVLVAALNIGALNLSNGFGRSRDLAVRMALGATRARIVQLLLAESLVLIGIGAAAGLLIAAWCAGILARLVLPGSGWEESGLVSGRIVAATLLAALGVGVASALAPAIRSSAIDPATCVRDAPAAARGRGRVWRVTLHAVQSFGAAAVLLAAGLFVHSAYLAGRLPLGFEPRGLFSITLRLPPDTRPSGAVVQAYNEVRHRLEHTPGVAGVASASAIPMGMTVTTLVIPESGIIDPSNPAFAEGQYLTRYSGDFFGITRTHLVRGRLPRADGTADEVVVSRGAAARLWPGRDPLGQCVRLYSPAQPCEQVVGITEDVVRFSISDRPTVQIYTPYRPGENPENLILLVRSDEKRPLTGTVLHRILADAFPAGVEARVRPLEDVVLAQSAVWRNGEKLFLLLSFLVVTLTSLGLYASLMEWACSRRYEFGVRLALGARPGAIAAAFIRFGVAVALLGIGTALLALHFLRRTIEPVLYQTSAMQPVVVTSTSLLLVVIAIVATLRPALHAARTDPVVLLRGNG